jgi:hypothetical protein
MLKSKPWYLVPWLEEESIEMVGGFIHFSIQAASDKDNGRLYRIILHD